MDAEGPRPPLNDHLMQSSGEPGHSAHITRSAGHRFEPGQLHGEPGEGRMARRILWFAVAVLAGSMLAVILYSIH